MMKRFVVLLGVAGLATLFLGACSAPGPSSAKSSTHIPANVLTFAYPKTWINLDPAESEATENDVLPEIYQTLATLNVTTGQLVPELALSWSSSDGAKQWTFHLRPGVKFQDGTPFTAEAVKLSYLRAKKLGQGTAPEMLSSVQSIDAVNPLTVQINLSRPQYFPDYAAAEYSMWIISPKDINKPSSWFKAGHGAGTGPYEWSSYAPNSQAILHYFPGYWGGWKPGQFTTIVYDMNPAATARAQEMASGQAQITYELPLESLKSYATSNTLKVVPLNIDGMQIMSLNTKRAPLNNLDVREAISYAFPDAEIAKDFYGSYASPQTTSLIPPGILGHDTGLPGFPYNLAKAKQLLAAAGYPHGGLTVQFDWVNTYPEQLLLANLWKQDLAQIGVNLQIVTYTINTSGAADGSASTTPDVQMGYWYPNYPGPLDYIGDLFTSYGCCDVSWWTSPALNNAYTQASELLATNTAAANQQLIKAQSIIFGNAIGFPVVDQYLTFVVAKDVTGLQENDFAADLYDLRLTGS
jgi:peptide/nickel transport system substrate-binding protein